MIVALPLQKSDASEVLRRLAAGCVSQTFSLKTGDGSEVFVAVAADGDTGLIIAEEVLRAIGGRLGRRRSDRASHQGASP